MAEEIDAGITANVDADGGVDNGSSSPGSRRGDEVAKDSASTASGGGSNEIDVPLAGLVSDLRLHVDASLQSFALDLRSCLDQLRAHQDDVAARLSEQQHLQWLELVEGPLGGFLEWHAGEILGAQSFGARSPRNYKKVAPRSSSAALCQQRDDLAENRPWGEPSPKAVAQRSDKCCGEPSPKTLAQPSGMPCGEPSPKALATLSAPLQLKQLAQPPPPLAQQVLRTAGSNAPPPTPMDVHCDASNVPLAVAQAQRAASISTSASVAKDAFHVQSTGLRAAAHAALANAAPSIQEADEVSASIIPTCCQEKASGSEGGQTFDSSNMFENSGNAQARELIGSNESGAQDSINTSPLNSSRPVNRRLSFSGRSKETCSNGDNHLGGLPHAVPGRTGSKLAPPRIAPPFHLKQDGRPRPLPLDDFESSRASNSSRSIESKPQRLGIPPANTVDKKVPALPPLPILQPNAVNEEDRVSIEVVSPARYATNADASTGDDATTTRLHRILEAEVASTMLTIIVFGFAVISTECRASLFSAAVETNRGVADVAGELTALAVLESGLCLLLAADLAARVALLRCRMLLPRERWWTALDVVVVGAALLEVLLCWARGMPPRSFGHIYALRSVRLLRVTQATSSLRVLRLFHELRLLVGMMRGSVASLFWLAIGMCMAFLLFGMVLTEAAWTFCADADVATETATTTALKAHFGSLGLSVYSLYRASFGVVVQTEIEEALLPLGVSYKVAFRVCTTMGGTLIGCIVTAVLVESLLRRSKNDHEVVARGARSEKSEFVESMETMLRQMDAHGSGFVPVVDLERRLKDAHVRAYFAAMELNMDHLSTLFRLLDNDQKGVVSIEKLISSCLYLEGRARAVDVVMLQYEVGVIRGMVHSLGEFVEESFDLVRKEL